MSQRLSILCVAGARPNFMKIAPVMAALSRRGITAPLVHTGQHYDAAMSDSFFADLGIPAPQVNLDVGSGSHAVQTAEIMRRFEPVLDDLQPDAVLVVGDVNSTIACALVAAKKGVKIVHVEAGLRSYDRAMPEEINRVLTDQISDLLFVTERSGIDNLVREGIDPGKVHFVGNVMIDTLFHHLEQAIPAEVTLAGRFPGGYALATLHRPSNVDEPTVLGPLLKAIETISRKVPVVFPLHPRTRGRIEAAGLGSLLECPTILALPPLGYLEILGLMRTARFVMTDSGGIQEETTALGVPCFTIRENTERPITIEQGTNTLVGSDPAALLTALDGLWSGRGKAGRVPELWDGQAAERIAEILEASLSR